MDVARHRRPCFPSKNVQISQLANLEAGEKPMSTTRSLFAGTSAIAIGVFLALSPVQVSAQQPRVVTQQMIDADDIGGVVMGQTGPEIGAWVIAETTELSVRFAKMVVTDDFGRYVIPDLPKANYSVWVRGYGLID